MASSTQIKAFFNIELAQIFELQEKPAEKKCHDQVGFFRLCARRLGCSVEVWLKMFCVGLIKSVGNAFRYGQPGKQSHCANLINIITLHFPEDAASAEDGTLTAGDETVGLAGCSEFIEL